MNTEKLKMMATSALVGSHIHDLQAATTPEEVAICSLAFREKLSEIIEFDPHASVPRMTAPQEGIKMS